MRAVRMAAAGVLALGVGTLSTFFAARSMGLFTGPSVTSPDAPQAQVVTTRHAVAAGQVIAASDLQLAPWHSPQPPREAHTRIEEVAGRVARQTLPADDLILEPKLAAQDARAGLAATIALGKRAISVRVNDVVGVAGFALPGSYVDVLVSARDAAGQSFSRTVLERVKVLAAAQDTQADPSRPKIVNAVTLELAPGEAETLDLARAIGNLSLVLRNESDIGRSESAGVRVGQLALPHRDIAAPTVTTTPAAPRLPRSTPAPRTGLNAAVIPPAAWSGPGSGPGSHTTLVNPSTITEWRGMSRTERQP